MKKLTKDKLNFTLLIYNIIIIALSISYFSYSLLLLKSIETFLRIIIILFFIILSMIFVALIIKNILKKKKLKIIILTLIITIISGGIIFVGYNINKIYNAIASITTTEQTYSSSIVTNIDSEINSIENIKEKTIGILNDKESVDGYQIPQEIIKEKQLTNELIEYNNYIDLIHALQDNKVDAVFLPTNYPIIFGTIEGLEKLEQETKIIYTKDKNIKTQKTLNTKNLDEPFTILLMGVDSETEEIRGSSFNGDSLILITFNPKTLNATMLSIPRDTYTPIACFAGQRRNKITHAAWNGETCMIDTIENMFDVTIDYYVKINFAGVVKIVDALGGIDVNVPYNLCEQNSRREFGENLVYVREGLQTLDGEQALALARNRHPLTEYCSSEWTNYNSNDFVRGQNQQLVIQGMLNKLKEINSIDTFYSMLDSISKSMETNMSTENILSFYNIGKDILMKNTSTTTDLSSLIGFERLYLSGYDQTIVDYDAIHNNGSQLALYNFVPYQGSINDISKAMKINLGLQEREKIKTFDFDINEPYKQEVIGKGYYNEAGIGILPSFVGEDISEAQEYCNRRGISITINKVETNAESMDGQIMTQDLPSGMDITYLNQITFSVAEYTGIKEPDKDTTKKKNETDKDEKKDNNQDDPINNTDPIDNIDPIDDLINDETNKKEAE